MVYFIKFWCLQLYRDLNTYQTDENKRNVTKSEFSSWQKVPKNKGFCHMPRKTVKIMFLVLSVILFMVGGGVPCDHYP